MSARSGKPTVPARVSIAELAETIEREVAEVGMAAAEAGHGGAPEEILSGDEAERIARKLGEELLVEPRDLALEMLYEWETRGECEDVGGRAGQLAVGVREALDELDRLIEGASDHWSVSRMPLVDRNVLRIALLELQKELETPTGVIVSEAVRLARTYSTERSGSFVNGVLAALAKEVRR